jgi:hypothetical protein
MKMTLSVIMRMRTMERIDGRCVGLHFLSCARDSTHPEWRRGSVSGLSTVTDRITAVQELSRKVPILADERCPGNRVVFSRPWSAQKKRARA